MSSSPNLLTSQAVAVSSRGECVVFRVGDTDVVMHYEQALDISEWLRDESLLVKQALGLARTVRTVGVLHDATAPRAKPIPNHKPGVRVKPALQTWRREDVSSRGSVIYVKVGPHTMGMPLEEVITLSQWLRVRAKEAMRTAGDDRHWTEVRKEG